MWCRRVDKRLGAYLDRELPPSKAAKVGAHLASCEACRHKYDSLRRLQALLAGLPDPAVPEDFVLRVLAQARRDLRPTSLAKKPAFAMRPWPSLAHAAALAAAVFLGLYLGIASATAGSKMEATPTANSGKNLSESLYAESFDLLPEGSPAAQYLALLNEKGR